MLTIVAVGIKVKEEVKATVIIYIYKKLTNQNFDIVIPKILHYTHTHTGVVTTPEPVVCRCRGTALQVFATFIGIQEVKRKKPPQSEPSVFLNKVYYPHETLHHHMSSLFS